MTLPSSRTWFTRVCPCELCTREKSRETRSSSRGMLRRLPTSRLLRRGRRRVTGSRVILLPPGEGGPKGRMRDLQAPKIPHPAFGHPLPEGEGTLDDIYPSNKRKRRRNTSTRYSTSATEANTGHSRVCTLTVSPFVSKISGPDG